MARSVKDPQKYHATVRKLTGSGDFDLRTGNYVNCPLYTEQDVVAYIRKRLRTLVRYGSRLEGTKPDGRRTNLRWYEIMRLNKIILQVMSACVAYEDVTYGDLRAVHPNEVADTPRGGRVIEWHGLRSLEDMAMPTDISVGCVLLRADRCYAYLHAHAKWFPAWREFMIALDAKKRGWTSHYDQRRLLFAGPNFSSRDRTHIWD